MLTDEEKRILLQNRLFAELPAERLDGLLQKLSSRTACFGKNSVIWGMGERIDHAGDRAVPGAWRRGGTRRMDRKAFPRYTRQADCLGMF